MDLEAGKMQNHIMQRQDTWHQPLLGTDHVLTEAEALREGARKVGTMPAFTFCVW